MEDKILELEKEIMDNSKTIAIVGLSPKKERTSHNIAKHIQSFGYKVIPVYPREDIILGEKVYRSLSDIPISFETVIFFLSADKVLPIVKEALDLKIKYLWMQLGIYSEEAKKLVDQTESKLIMDRCFYMEYGKLHID